MRHRLPLIGATLAWPAVSHAADSSGLFVLLFGVPSLALAIVFAAISLKAPRGGATLSAMLLASVLPVYFWAKAMGYGESAGTWLELALIVGAIGLVVALVKLILPGRNQAPTDGS